jgi:hypothetical protein
MTIIHNKKGTKCIINNFSYNTRVKSHSQFMVKFLRLPAKNNFVQPWGSDEFGPKAQIYVFWFVFLKPPLRKHYNWPKHTERLNGFEPDSLCQKPEYK